MNGGTAAVRGPGDAAPRPGAVEAWAEARELLYQAFAGVPRPVRVSGCAHCVPADADLPMLAGPVAQLPPAVLAQYAFKATTTWGDAEHLRYFTPRLIECVVQDADGFPSAETVLGKLALAGWLAWPAPQISAVRHCLLTWWQLTLSSDRPHDADHLLCAVAATGTSLAPYLSAWADLPTAASLTMLHDFLTDDLRWSKPPRLRNPSWRQRPQAEQEVVAWLTDGTAASALEAAFQRATDETVHRGVVGVRVRGQQERAPDLGRPLADE